MISWLRSARSLCGRCLSTASPLAQLSWRAASGTLRDGNIIGMLASSPIVVHVLNATDWASLAAVISTGLVGVLGIGAAIWQAVHGWRREDKCARIAEKRSLYSHCLAVLNEYDFADTFKPTMTDAASVSAWLDQVRRTSLNTLNAIFEVALIAPDEVTDKLEMVFDKAMKPEDKNHLPALTRAQAMAQLAEAMRADLGERPLSTWLNTDAASRAPDNGAIEASGQPPQPEPAPSEAT